MMRTDRLISRQAGQLVDADVDKEERFSPRLHSLARLHLLQVRPATTTMRFLATLVA